MEVTQNEYAYAIYSRHEVTFGQGVKATVGYVVINFEAISLSTLRDIKKNIL